MNAPFPKIGSARTYAERISLAKAARNNGDEWTEQFHLDRIVSENDGEWSDAAQYAIDTDDYGEVDALIEREERFERVLEASSYYPGNELPDWRYNQIMDEHVSPSIASARG